MCKQGDGRERGQGHIHGVTPCESRNLGAGCPRSGRWCWDHPAQGPELLPAGFGQQKILSSTSGWMATGWSQASSIWRGSTWVFSRNCDFKWDSECGEGVWELTSCLTRTRGTDVGLCGTLGDRLAFPPQEFMCVKYELHFILSHCPEMSEISIIAQTGKTPWELCVFSLSLSHTESIFPLNNYCQSWIRACQRCRKESNPFLQTFKTNMTSLCWFFFFLNFFRSTVIWSSLNNLNDFREGVVHKGSLGRPSAGVQLASEKHCSVTSWGCLTVNLKSSLGDYSPHVNATAPTSYDILRILAVKSEGRQ